MLMPEGNHFYNIEQPARCQNRKDHLVCNYSYLPIMRSASDTRDHDYSLNIIVTNLLTASCSSYNSDAAIATTRTSNGHNLTSNFVRLFVMPNLGEVERIDDY